MVTGSLKKTEEAKFAPNFMLFPKNLAHEVMKYIYFYTSGKDLPLPTEFFHTLHIETHKDLTVSGLAAAALCLSAFAPSLGGLWGKFSIQAHIRASAP